MVSATAEFTAPTANFDPFAQPLSLGDVSHLPHMQVSALVDAHAEVRAHIWQTARAHDGSLGLQTAEGAAIFRTGQVLHLTFGNSAETAETYYIAHDGELRQHDPLAEYQPIEVITFRRGLSERFTQERHHYPDYEAQTFHSVAEPEAIGATIVANVVEAPSGIAKPGRLARLRTLGSAVMSAATNLVQDLRGKSGRHHVRHNDPNQARAMNMHAATVQGSLQGRHRRREAVHVETVLA